MLSVCPQRSEMIIQRLMYEHINFQLLRRQRDRKFTEDICILQTNREKSEDKTQERTCQMSRRVPIGNFVTKRGKKRSSFVVRRSSPLERTFAWRRDAGPPTLILSLSLSLSLSESLHPRIHAPVTWPGHRVGITCKLRCARITAAYPTPRRINVYVLLLSSLLSLQRFAFALSIEYRLALFAICWRKFARGTRPRLAPLVSLSDWSLQENMMIYTIFGNKLYVYNKIVLKWSFYLILDVGSWSWKYSNTYEYNYLHKYCKIFGNFIDTDQVWSFKYKYIDI